MSSGNSKVAIIILNWNGEKLLRRYLPSVVRYSNLPSVEVIVADNGSTDTSVAMVRKEFPSVKILEHTENYGYAQGNHLSLLMTDSDYVLFLNNDVEVSEGWLEPLIRCLDEDKNVVAVQPKILSFNEPEKFEYAGACGGHIDRFGYPFCRGRVIGTTEIDKGQYDTPQRVFWCSGAAMLIRRDAYISAGGFDSYFFAHMEEIDLCWRMAHAGGVMMVEPESKVFHLGGGTLPMNHPGKLKLNYRNNLLMHYKNLTKGEFFTFIMVRLFMDFASLSVFLLKREFGNAKAVMQAYKEFLKMRKRYTPLNRSGRVSPYYRGWIIWRYYVQKRVTYSELHYKL